MKFYVKNNFTFGGVKKYKGETIEVNPNKISELQKANVLGAPVKEVKIETAVINPVENEMISRNNEKSKLDTSRFLIPRLRTKNIKKKDKKRI